MGTGITFTISHLSKVLPEFIFQDLYDAAMRDELAGSHHVDQSSVTFGRCKFLIAWTSYYYLLPLIFAVSDLISYEKRLL